MARKLTERQQKFIDALFADANGNIRDAKVIAGYSPNTNNQEIIQSLKEEILEATQIYMASNAPKAAMAMVGGLYDPTELGIKDKMAAAKQLMRLMPFYSIINKAKSIHFWSYFSTLP